MTIPTDTDLYRRGCDTLLASWEEYARGSTGAVVKRFPGVAAAVFPNPPERAVYNNALLDRDLNAGERAAALDAMQAAYAAAGVDRFAAWVHDSDEAMRGDLERRGYTLDTTTRAMGMALDEGPQRTPPSPRPACSGSNGDMLGALDLSHGLTLAGQVPSVGDLQRPVQARNGLPRRGGATWSRGRPQVDRLPRKSSWVREF